MIGAAPELSTVSGVPIRVAVADDSLLVREGIQHMLADAPEIELVAVTADRDTLMEAVERLDPEVVLTDIRMPPGHGTEGVDVANALRESHPQIGVIVISQYAEPHYAVALLEH